MWEPFYLSEVWLLRHLGLFRIRDRRTNNAGGGMTLCVECSMKYIVRGEVLASGRVGLDPHPSESHMMPWTDHTGPTG